MSNQLNWGILGTGMIAKKFAADLPNAGRSNLVAVGSRSIESASAFTNNYTGTPYATYDELLADPNVNAVYNSLPNGMHHEWTIKALNAGKHVLCEKPFASDFAEAEEMFDTAEKTGNILVEAFMYRTHPGVKKLLEVIHSGILGQIKIARANFTFHREVDPADARYAPAQAGGALMDVGCYCFNLLRAALQNEPETINAEAHLHPMGVDDYSVGTLRFPNDILATFSCGMTVFNNWQFSIGGTNGHITAANPWDGCESFTYTDPDGKTTTYDNPSEKGLYAYEAEAFENTVLDNATPWTTPQDTLGNMHLLDRAREQIGIMV